MLPRAARLKRNRDFKAVYQQRRSYGSANLVLYVRIQRASSDTSSPDSATAKPGSGVDRLGPVRIGFVISKKVAKRANVRNRLKRRLREICRANVLPRLRKDLVADMLIAARSAATEVDYARLAADVETLGRQAGLFVRGD